MGEEANSAIGECAALDFGSTSMSFGGGEKVEECKEEGKRSNDNTQNER